MLTNFDQIWGGKEIWAIISGSCRAVHFLDQSLAKIWKFRKTLYIAKIWRKFGKTFYTARIWRTCAKRFYMDKKRKVFSKI